MEERLTKRDGIAVYYARSPKTDSIPQLYEEWRDIEAEALHKLAEYEDAEEAGTLVKLPCKVGDTVYLVIADEIFEWEVKSIEIFDFDTVLRLGHKGTCDYAAEYISSLNDRFFLTYEAAEKRLAELKGEMK